MRVTVLGEIFTTETATIVPSGWKICVMPTFRPMRPIVFWLIERTPAHAQPWSGQGGPEHRSERTSCVRERGAQGPTRPWPGSAWASSHLDLDVDASGKRESHQGVHRLRRGIQDVDEPLVGADLELLPGVLVDERGPQGGELFGPGRQRHGADDVSARALGRLHDLGCRLVEQPVVVGLEADPDPLLRHLVPYCRMVTMAPAPTVRPPSRMAKRWPTSRAIGVISSTVISTLSPGMIISAPSGRPIAPVTSVVRR